MSKRAVNIDTAKKAEKALGGKKVPLQTVEPIAGTGESIGKRISWAQIQQIHEDHDRKPGLIE